MPPTASDAPGSRSTVTPSHHADGFSLGYGAVRRLARFLLGLFYRRIDVVGAEHVPASGPLILAANHHNSLVDAMLLLAVVPRRLRTLANAPLFRHPLIGPFLRLVGALPVHRRQEAGGDPARNAALFAATTATLQAGGAILIFPEGRTQPEPALQELRSGAARMLLAAEEATPPAVRVALLPVGLVFHEPGTFREGRALVSIGPALTSAATGGAPRGSDDAVRDLTARLAGALRARILEAGDRATLRLLHTVEELWQAEGGPLPQGEAARVEWLKRALRTYQLLLLREPGRVQVLRRELESFAGEMEAARLTAAQLTRAYSPGVVVRFVLREGSALLIGLPLALWGLVSHALPYQLTAAVVRRIPHTDEEEATDKLAAGLVLYPLAWLAEAWAVLRLGGGWAAVVFVAGLLPTGFFALAWRSRLEHVVAEARALRRWLGDPGLRQRLRERRQALAGELLALARLVPEAWGE